MSDSAGEVGSGSDSFNFFRIITLRFQKKRRALINWHAVRPTKLQLGENSQCFCVNAQAGLPVPLRLANGAIMVHL
jgi:hypothetical protein